MISNINRNIMQKGNLKDNFSEYIIKNYANSQKIVEVGVGKLLKTSNILKEKLPNTEILTIDINPSEDYVIYDDITKPNKSIYKNADLIYSIRPPEELQNDIMNLSQIGKCDIIIKPLTTEEINFNLQSKFKLINYKKNFFYLYSWEQE